MPALEAVETDVRQWYRSYLDTFKGLAAGERTDLESVLAFFGVPLVVVAEDRHLALPDRDAVLGAAKGQIDQLRRANYASSTVLRLDVRPLNARAALVEGVFSRYDRAGKELERLGTTYLVVKTAEGWRFTSIVLTAP